MARAKNPSVVHCDVAEASLRLARDSIVRQFRQSCSLITCLTERLYLESVTGYRQTESKRQLFTFRFCISWHPWSSCLRCPDLGFVSAHMWHWCFFLLMTVITGCQPRFYWGWWLISVLDMLCSWWLDCHTWHIAICINAHIHIQTHQVACLLEWTNQQGLHVLSQLTQEHYG